ncbi:MAG: hypothetical protein HY613_11170 [Candidatus Rokubacteria bacterium]|nr:hypothetical protein [Candidatus Rokubacteria bacterium]
MATLAKVRAMASLAGFLAAAILIAGCTHGRLIIEDEDLAAWMVAHNTFAKPPDVTWPDWYAKYHRDGVLFQFGDYKSIGDIFGSISFERRGASVRELRKGDFIWINLEVEDPTRPSPAMERSHLASLYPVGSLYPDPNHPTPCDLVETNDDFLRICRVLPCQTDADMKKVPRSCIRMRSLSGFMRPYAVMTYWQGPHGYRLKVVVPAAGRHPQHIFEFKDRVKISIHKDGAPPESLDDIDVIRVKVKPPTAGQPSPGHGGYHSPPWEP